ELDQEVLNGLCKPDSEVLCSLSVDRLNRAPGTAESLNWVTIAGAMDPLPMTLIDYVPCYRSPAGTGIGATFGYWQ
ncbi:MAG TPA: extradiol ring-cleavage dioxygenase, partial [Chloroflexota bacterium]